MSKQQRQGQYTDDKRPFKRSKNPFGSTAATATAASASASGSATYDTKTQVNWLSNTMNRNTTTLGLLSSYLTFSDQKNLSATSKAMLSSSQTSLFNFLKVCENKLVNALKESTLLSIPKSKKKYLDPNLLPITIYEFLLQRSTSLYSTLMGEKSGDMFRIAAKTNEKIKNGIEAAYYKKRGRDISTVKNYDKLFQGSLVSITNKYKIDDDYELLTELGNVFIHNFYSKIYIDTIQRIIVQFPTIEKLNKFLKYFCPKYNRYIMDDKMLKEESFEKFFRTRDMYLQVSEKIQQPLMDYLVSFSKGVYWDVNYIGVDDIIMALFNLADCILRFNQYGYEDGIRVGDVIQDYKNSTQTATAVAATALANKK